MLGVFEYNYLHILRDISIRKRRHSFPVPQFSCKPCVKLRGAGKSKNWKFLTAKIDRNISDLT